MSYLLALDQGTSSSRSIVFDEQGHIVASAQREFRQIFPQPGWVEHDPNEIWDSQLATAHEALAKAGLKAADIAAIGITNQRETTVLWHRRSGQPVHNAIVWQDRRSEPFCAQLRAQGLEPMMQRSTGLRIDAVLLRHQAALVARPCARRAHRRGEGRAGLRHGGQLAAVEADGGAVHATDVQQRLAHHALRHPPQRLGPGAAQGAAHPGERAAEGLPVEPCVWPHRSGAVRRGHPHRRHGRRPAERAVRPGLLQGRTGEEHLRHRLLHADAHRRQVPGLEERPHHHQRRAAHRHAGITPSRAACSSVARWCSGCATGCAPSRPAAKCRRWPGACPTQAA